MGGREEDQAIRKQIVKESVGEMDRMWMIKVYHTKGSTILRSQGKSMVDGRNREDEEDKQYGEFIECTRPTRSRVKSVLLEKIDRKEE